MEADIIPKVHLALRNRHSGDSWAYFEELRTKTGYSGHVGYIDAYAAGLWKENRGFIAYEVKISRSDFKSDVAEFAVKQAAAIRNSTEFFYACPHGLIQPSEVPEVAGLMWVDAAGAKVKKVAPIRELKDGSLDVGFIMALLRAASGGPAKRSLPLKYLGKDIDEAALLELAKDVGARKDEKDIKIHARHEAAKVRLRSRQILTQFCHAIGMSEYSLEYDTVEKVAQTMESLYMTRTEEMRLSHQILYNTKEIKKAAEDLELLVKESSKTGGQDDTKADRKETPDA